MACTRTTTRWLSIIAVVVNVAACASDDDRMTPRKPEWATVSVGRLARAPTSITRESAPRTTPAPRTCPATAPVSCPDGCCEAGLACGSAGGCGVPTVNASCPVDAPIECERSGDLRAFDLSGNDNHFVLSSPATLVDAGHTGGGAKNVSGCGDPTIVASADGIPTGGQPITVELWTYTDSTMALGNENILFMTASAAGVGDHALNLYFGNGGLTWMVPGGAPLAEGWRFVAATFEDGSARLYIDGALVVHGTAADPPGGATRIVLGAHAAGGCYNYPGIIDELRVLGRAADADEITAHFTGGRLGLVPGTVGLWHFDEPPATFCCAVGTTCDPGGGCVAAGYGCPSPCDGDDLCCEAGEICTPFGCADATVDHVSCPEPDRPVVCFGWCCAIDDVCTPEGCFDDAHPPTAPEGVCVGGLAIAFDADTLVCCPGIDDDTLSWWFEDDSSTCTGDLVATTCFTEPASGCDCSPGYTCCAADGHTCSAFGIRYYECAAGATACTGDATRSGGCCASGTSCAGFARCCPTGHEACGDGCCAVGECDPGGGCRAIPAACSPECPPDTTCHNGYCISAAPVPMVCGAGTPCGDTCCPSGQSCHEGTCLVAPVAVVCPEGLSSQGGPGGLCCREGFTAFGNAGPGPSGFYCRCVSSSCLHPYEGPGGDACGKDRYCERGEACVDDEPGAVCCPPELGASCGASCCPDGVPCVSGACGCPEDHPVVCGASCCGPDDACVDGACVATCDDAAACGEYCCDDEAACEDGVCGCPADHPVGCGVACCLPGATCRDALNCDCPPGRARCGSQLCCAPGQACVDGACREPIACGAGELEVSLRFCAGGAFSDACECNGGATDTCVRRDDFPAAGACTGLGDSCTPDGRTLDRPCCPGLVCAVGCAGGGGGACVAL
ncbi:MAG: LamG domain-containing protein [Deltaproteobacteria bacterium]|nr:LamG domain-containing protein [Deltaproteobacteria bacterium]